jgi:hypothetical protein
LLKQPQQNDISEEQERLSDLSAWPVSEADPLARLHEVLNLCHDLPVNE